MINVVGIAGSGIKIGKIVKGVFSGNPLGAAVNATMMLYGYVESEKSKMHDAVKKREGCPHIQMLEAPWGAPSPSAFGYVAEHGGVAWRPGQVKLFFYHPQRFFKPVLFEEAYVRKDEVHSTVRIVSSDLEYRRFVPLPPHTGYGCRMCYEARVRANTQ